MQGGESRLQETMRLIDTLLVNPYFTIDHIYAFVLALNTFDDVILNKLLSWEKLDDRVLRAHRTTHNNDGVSLLSMALTETPIPYPVKAFKKMLEFAQLRDEVCYMFVNF